MEFLLALAQVDPHVGGLNKNLAMMVENAQKAKEAGASIIVFPELVTTGYPPEDLLHKPIFLKRLVEMEQEFVLKLAEIGIDAIYGTIRQGSNGLLNAGVFIKNGEEVGFAAKWRLPNYGVFDEKRYFTKGVLVRTFAYKGCQFGITICEDLWHPGGPLQELAQANTDFVINLNASPYHLGKQREREEMISKRISESSLPIFYINLVGGQDELVFDGGSFVMNRDGAVLCRSLQFTPDIALVKIASLAKMPVEIFPGKVGELYAPDKEVYSALCLGLRDYVEKNGFAGVVLGLSGGIDSALTAAICADALGPDRVEAVMMPSQYTSEDSLVDAREGAKNIGIRLVDIPIDNIFSIFRSELAQEFSGLDEDVTEENIQPRIRATLLMAISNKKGYLLVTTGNKSEVSVGYATLYGDMAGGYSVLKDVLKERVFKLATARNSWATEAGEPLPIPLRVITKPPSAELRPDQKDSDSLPPYPILDKILEMYVEQECSLEEIVAHGIDRECAARVVLMVDRSEYKRRQAAPGVRITPRAFGKDRRYPITNGFSNS
ncbi:MAG: NAD+ synthase [Magnetococcales bacterium]|nr:NAD+ synthase [Magnetococcales bacterium]